MKTKFTILATLCGFFLAVFSAWVAEADRTVLGSAILFTPTIAEKDVNVIVKILFRVTNENRADGNDLIAGVAL